MEKKSIYKRFPRRNFSGHGIAVPDLSLSPRVLLDRISKGLPVNARLSKHIPLPPDGDDINDFTTGIEEITDVTEAVTVIDKIREQQKYIEDEKKKAQEEALGKTEVPPATD